MTRNLIYLAILVFISFFSINPQVMAGCLSCQGYGPWDDTCVEIQDPEVGSIMVCTSTTYYTGKSCCDLSAFGGSYCNQTHVNGAPGGPQIYTATYMASGTCTGTKYEWECDHWDGPAYRCINYGTYWKYTSWEDCIAQGGATIFYVGSYVCD